MNNIQFADINSTNTQELNAKNHYVFIRNSVCGVKYIYYVLSNINIYNYLKDKYTIDDLTELQSSYIDGRFLYIKWYDKNSINEFLDDYGEYFTEQLKTDLLIAFDKIYDKIKNRGVLSVLI